MFHVLFLTMRQYSFQPHNSTLKIFLATKGKVTHWLDEESPVDVMYPDFAKSPYSLNHSLLPTKLIAEELPQGTFLLGWH